MTRDEAQKAVDAAKVEHQAATLALRRVQEQMHHAHHATRMHTTTPTNRAAWHPIRDAVVQAKAVLLAKTDALHAAEKTLKETKV